MSFLACLTDQFKQDVLNGLHQPTDTYKIALYTQRFATDKNRSSTTYNTTGELPTAGGYTQGGQALSGFSVGLAGDIAYIDFDDPVWNPATFTADAAVIYNATRGNNILAVLGFDATSSTNATWTIQFPPPGSGAVITIF